MGEQFLEFDGDFLSPLNVGDDHDKMPMFPEAALIRSFQVLCLLKWKPEFYGEKMYLTKEICCGRKLTENFYCR